MIFVILILLVASILQYRFTDKQFLVFLISISTVVRLITVLFVDVPMIGDMKAMYESAKQIAIGNNIENIAQLPLLFMNQSSFVYLVIRYSLYNYLIFYFVQELHFSFIALRQWSLEKSVVVLHQCFTLYIFQIYL